MFCSVRLVPCGFRSGLFARRAHWSFGRQRSAGQMNDELMAISWWLIVAGQWLMMAISDWLMNSNQWLSNG